MVFINGSKFKVYTLDTVQTVEKRVAAMLDTITEYLYFPEGIPTLEILHSDNQIVVNDLLKTIRESASKNKSIITLIDKLKPIIATNSNIKDKIIRIWMAYNDVLANAEQKHGVLVLEPLKTALEKPTGDYYYKNQIADEWVDRLSYRKNLEELIENNKKRSKITKKLFKRFENTDEEPVSDIEIDRIRLDLILDIKETPLLELFNEVVLSNFIPFARTKKFCKILRNFNPPYTWGEKEDQQVDEEKDIVEFRVLEKERVYSVQSSNYSNIIMSYTDDIERKIKTSILVKMKKGNITKDQFIERFITTFPKLDINVENERESEVIGLFFFPGLHFFKYVFSDLVMNNPMFSRLMYINEFDHTTKKKSGLFIHFEHPLTGEITMNISQKRVRKNDPELRNQDIDFFPVGSYYTRLRSSGTTMKQLTLFQTMISKLMTIYKDERNGIITFYRQYIPNFGTIEDDDDDVDVETLHEIDPELFVKKYSRSCHVGVTNVSEEKALNMIEEGKSVMKFPRDVPDDPDDTRFHRDGENQNYYVCEQDTHPFVGLKENKLKNANLFPYIPCCYKTNQTNKPNYRYYFEGKEPDTKGEKQTDCIRSNKILKNDQCGYLPLNIASLFTLIEPDPKYTYIRKGVFRNENSFLKVVMEALSDETGINIIKDHDEIADILNQTRRKLATKKMAALCRQEMYDRTISEIIDDLNNMDVYLDPNLYIHLLEDYFDVNIYLFSKRIMNGEMNLPRHIQAYYRTSRKSRRNIYVYEHSGSETDRFNFPQCELIAKFNTKAKTQAEGIPQETFSEKEARSVKRIFEMLRKSYALNTQIHETIGIPWKPTAVKIKSQGIDSYGKTRKINIKYKESEISLITSPIQPIRAIETPINKTYLANNTKIALELAKDLGMVVQSQTVSNGVINEINCLMGNITIIIPVKESAKIVGIEEKYSGSSYSTITHSNLDIYNRNKKMARYLIEYVYWMYSKYLDSKGIAQITDDNISQFSTEAFIINPGYVYDHVPNNFSEDSTFIDRNRIVVTSEETLKRLIYVLRVEAVRNRESILKYHSRSVIQNYYVDISDFDHHPIQVILYGDYSLEKWIQKNNISYELHDKIMIGTSPYFFKNTKIDEKIYLAQNTISEQKAHDIALSWFRDGHNVGIHAKNISRVTFTLYKYISQTNIEPIHINGKHTAYDVKILGYKIRGQEYYTVLLEL